MRKRSPDHAQFYHPNRVMRMSLCAHVYGSLKPVSYRGLSISASHVNTHVSTHECTCVNLRTRAARTRDSSIIGCSKLIINIGTCQIFRKRARLQISSHILEIFDETSMASQHQLKPTTALTDLTNFDQKKESALGVEFGGGKLPFCDARFTHPTMSVKISRVISKRRCFAALVTAGFSRPNYQNRMMIGGARVCSAHRS